jgi:hypothetical protein
MGVRAIVNVQCMCSAGVGATEMRAGYTGRGKGKDYVPN